MPPNVMAIARPARISCLRPRPNRLIALPVVAERSITTVLTSVSIGMRGESRSRSGARRIGCAAAAPRLRRGRVALTGLGAGGRPRGRAEIGRRQRTAADAVNQDRISRRSGLAVDDDDARPFWREMLVAPGDEGPQYRPEIATGLRHHVFVARRPLAVATALEQPSLD